jgi:AraC-like DNA-binding protein
MQPRRRPLYVLHSDRALCARIQQAALPDYEVTLVASWESLRAAIVTLRGPAVLIVDSHYSTVAYTTPAVQLRVVLGEFAWLPVVCVVGESADSMAHARTLGEWGVRAVLNSAASAEAIIMALREVQAESVVSFVSRAIPPDCGGQARTLLHAAAVVGVAGGQVSDLARALHISSRTLVRHSAEAGILAPRQLLVWMRILLATQLLDQDRYSVAAVAFACGYASDTGLRRALQDTLNASPRALRRRGAFLIAAAGFRALLSRAK